MDWHNEHLAFPLYFSHLLQLSYHDHYNPYLQYWLMSQNDHIYHADTYNCDCKTYCVSIYF